MPTLLSIESLEADRQYVSRKLMEADANPWGTARLMWQSRLEDIEQQIAVIAANRSNYASVALIFDGNPVIGSRDIRLDFTTDALANYQKIISIALAATLVGELPERGPLPGVEQSHLFIREIVHGSMGFILEEIVPEQQTFLPTPLKNAVEGATQLVAGFSSASDVDFEAALGAAPPRLVDAVQKFAKMLYEAGAGTKILGDHHLLTLTTDEVGRLSRRLNEVEVSEEVGPVDGILLGVLPESREFELRPSGENAITIKGAVSEELAFKYTADGAFKERLLLQLVRAQIKTIRTTRNGRLVRERRVLEALEALSPQQLAAP
jgi:hypothetical protein